MSWRDRAACAGHPLGPDAWTERDAGNWGASDANRRAIAVCKATCPVRRDCLTEALATERGLNKQSRNGLWGGTTPVQREVFARMKRRNRKVTA